MKHVFEPIDLSSHYRSNKDYKYFKCKNCNHIVYDDLATELFSYKQHSTISPFSVEEEKKYNCDQLTMIDVMR